MFFTQLRAVWLSKGHDRDYKLSCKLCSAQYSRGWVPVAISKRFYKSQGYPLLQQGLRQPCNINLESKPKGSSVLTTAQYAPHSSKCRTIPLSWTTYGFLDKGGFLKVWPAITSMKQILKQAWTNTADSEAHLEGTGQQVEVAQENHSRGQCTNPVITWAAASPTKGQASCLAGVIDWLRQQQQKQAQWESFYANYHGGLWWHQFNGTAWCWNKSIIVIPYEMSLQAWARAEELKQACDCEE